ADAIIIFAGALDVIGRITGRCLEAAGLVEQREEPVKTDGGTIKGGKIKRTHKHILQFERHAGSPPDGRTITRAQPSRPARRKDGKRSSWSQEDRRNHLSY